MNTHADGYGRRVTIDGSGRTGAIKAIPALDDTSRFRAGTVSSGSSAMLATTSWAGILAIIIVILAFRTGYLHILKAAG